MNKEKIANLLAEKMAIVVMDKATLDALKAAEKEGNPIKIWFATRSTEAWLEVRKEKMKNLEADLADLKLDLIAECEKQGIDPNDFGLFDEVKVNFEKKEDE